MTNEQLRITNSEKKIDTEDRRQKRFLDSSRSKKYLERVEIFFLVCEIIVHLLLRLRS